ELFPFLLVHRQPEAADAAEGVARERGHSIETALRPAPELRCAGTERRHGDVVGSRRAAQGEAAVATARSAGNLPRVLQANPQPALGEGQRGRTARDAATDDEHVGRPVEPTQRDLRRRLLQPVGKSLAQKTAALTREKGTKTRLPTSPNPFHGGRCGT